jgi:N-acetylglucosamine kinase-like BadF-type ATPase
VSATDRRVGGVDAGGSHTTAVVTDGALALLGRAEGPPGAVGPHTVEAAADAVMHALRTAQRLAGGGPLAACVVGAAGAANPAVSAALTTALRTRGAPARTMVATDADAAFASAFPEGPGILLLAGTGSIALARDAAGDRHRVGGRGWRVGDEGSGYALGRGGVAAVMQALDGRGPGTALAHALPSALGLKGIAELVAWAGQAEARAMAALGAVVQQAADAGDAVALGLVDAAAEDLVAHVAAMRPPFAPERGVPVVLSGGALAAGLPLRRRVVTLLGARVRWVTVREVSVDAAMGAARIALDLTG